MARLVDKLRSSALWYVWIYTVFVRFIETEHWLALVLVHPTNAVKYAREREGGVWEA